MDCILADSACVLSEELRGGYGGILGLCLIVPFAHGFYFWLSGVMHGASYCTTTHNVVCRHHGVRGEARSNEMKWGWMERTTGRSVGKEQHETEAEGRCGNMRVVEKR